MRSGRSSVGRKLIHHELRPSGLEPLPQDPTVAADRGYFKGEQILQCAEAGITPLAPKSMTSNSKAEGRFDKQDFI